jgi:hypothetical protein
MGFSPEIKQKVLVASARHCCVCHRYKGIKMEVHHLIQEADGGPNTFENAIPLCFDCHSDAGHYNDRHPKGTKFSISELTYARDAWYEFVRNNSLTEKLIISEHIQTMYYVLHTFEILQSVINNDFTSINKFRKRTYLSSNVISDHWNDLLRTHLKDYHNNIEQRIIIELRQFNSIEEYNEQYDNVEIIDKSSDEFPFYEAKRKVSWTNLLHVKPNSFINEISKSGIDVERFCVSLLYKNSPSCGGERPEFGYTEYLSIKPLSFIFLGITNASKEQIKLNWLMCSSNPNRIELPNFNLLPYEMVLVPIATAINLSNINNSSICIEHNDGDRAIDFSRVIDKLDFSENDVIFFENKITPIAITYNDNKGEYETDIHEFDCNNLYSINSYWQCGSCPHLFFVNNKGQQEYVRELLINCSGMNGSDFIDIPSETFKIIIRELEDETTYLDKIYINDKLIFSNVILNKGHFLFIKVNPFDRVFLEGCYRPFNTVIQKPNDKWFRNEIVRQSNLKYNFTLQ